MINVNDYKNLNNKYDTEAFQKAIDIASERGGETVFVPFGEYVLATVILKDNTNLVFENGVKIKSAEKLSDFNKDEDIPFFRYQDLSHSKYTCAMFYADNIKNISISGCATIDMLGIWDEEDKRSDRDDGYYRGAKVFALRKVDGIRITDLKIINATDISILMGNCKNAILSKLYINSHIDGISPDGCEDVVISDCIIKTGDDALVFKTSYFDNKIHHCERITVSNCVMSSRANAIKFGTESNGDFKYINITNCSVLNTQHSGIAIESADGGNIFAINISNITMCNVANPFFIYACERLRAPEDTKMGTISNINISNVYADVNDEQFDAIDSWCPKFMPASGKGVNISYPSIIMSSNEDNKIKDVSLTNVHIQVLGGQEKIERLIPSKSEYPECDRFKLPCYGLFAKNVDNLQLVNVSYSTKKPDSRVAQIIE